VCEVAGVLILIGAFALYQRYEGARACVAANVSAVAAQVTQNAAMLATQNAEIAKELVAHETQVVLPPLPSTPLRCVRVNPAPRTVSKTTAAQRTGDASAPLSGAAGGGPQPFDPSPTVKDIGSHADAQVVELQSYIANVCLAH
jgi:hypothetical protein